MKFIEFKNDKIYHIDDFMRSYDRHNCGHFFDKDTMKFFNSRILYDSVVRNDKCYFITSERFEKMDRTYTVRIGEIHNDKLTVNDFESGLTRYKALKILKEIKHETR